MQLIFCHLHSLRYSRIDFHSKSCYLFVFQLAISNRNTPKLNKSDFSEKIPSIVYSGDMELLKGLYQKSNPVILSDLFSMLPRLKYLCWMGIQVFDLIVLWKIYMIWPKIWVSKCPIGHIHKHLSDDVEVCEFLVQHIFRLLTVFQLFISVSLFLVASKDSCHPKVGFFGFRYLSSSMLLTFISLWIIL